MQFYYGWRVVAISAALYMLVFGATIASFSLYVVPVSREFGLSRAQMNSAFALVNVGSAIWAPFIGRSLDRMSAKLVIGISGVLIGIGFLTLALSPWLWLDGIALLIGVAIGLDGAAMLTLTVLVARWFRARRGRAMTLSVIGQALGVVSVPLGTASLITHYGWRNALLVTGAVLLIVLTSVAVLLRERPAAGELEAEGEEPCDTKLESSTRLPALLCQPNFWLIAVSIALVFTISSTFGISIVPLGISYGLSMTQAALMTSCYAIAAIVAKLILAGFADRVSTLTMVTGLLALGIPLFLAFPLVHDGRHLFFYVILLGLAVGGFAALLPVLQADVFGLPSYGTVRGFMIPIQSAFVATGAFVSGKLYDQTGSYVLMFMCFAAAQIVVIVMLQFARWSQARTSVVSTLHQKAEDEASLSGESGKP